MEYGNTGISRKGRGNAPHLAQKEATKQPRQTTGIAANFTITGPTTSRELK